MKTTFPCRWPRLLAVALGILVQVAAAKANLLVNGSFENGTYTFGGDGAQNVAPGESTITGWSVITKSIAPILLPNAYFIVPEDGNISLDLQGYYEFFPYGGVQQTIATQSGSHYRLSFWIGVQNDLGNGLGPASITATAGTTTQQFTNTLTGAGNQWQQFALDFTAAGSTTTISLSGQSTQGGAYIGLDNASVDIVMSGTNPGDYNINTKVDAADFVIWRDTLGTSTLLPNDPIGGVIGPAQFNQWRTHFGQTVAGTVANGAVPEPASFLQMGVIVVGLLIQKVSRQVRSAGRGLGQGQSLLARAGPA